MGIASYGCCGWCCGGLSFFGAVFLFILASLAENEVATLDIGEASREDVVDNFRGAAIMYVVTFILSLGCCWKAKRDAANQYDFKGE